MGTQILLLRPLLGVLTLMSFGDDLRSCEKLRLSGVIALGDLSFYSSSCKEEFKDYSSFKLIAVINIIKQIHSENSPRTARN